jgi:hypothetical protein
MDVSPNNRGGVASSVTAASAAPAGSPMAPVAAASCCHCCNCGESAVTAAPRSRARCVRCHTTEPSCLERSCCTVSRARWRSARARAPGCPPETLSGPASDSTSESPSSKPPPLSPSPCSLARPLALPALLAAAAARLRLRDVAAELAAPVAEATLRPARDNPATELVADAPTAAARSVGGASMPTKSTRGAEQGRAGSAMPCRRAATAMLS